MSEILKLLADANALHRKRHFVYRLYPLRQTSADRYQPWTRAEVQGATSRLRWWIHRNMTIRPATHLAPWATFFNTFCYSRIVSKPKILIIVGPTASGKTGLAIELAKQFNGEVVSADSRQVYKGLDIGSAKVTLKEMNGVPHHLLDVADPKKDVYTAADFKNDATKVIGDILARGKLPIICGGTFFYIDALLGKVSLPEVEPDMELRAELEEKSAAELLDILKKLDPERAANVEKENPRRLVRAIEIARAFGYVPEAQITDCPYQVLTIGLTVDMEKHGDVLKTRIVERLKAGMMEEVERLLAEGVTHERLEKFGLEYRYLSRYLRGLLPFNEMVDELTIKSRQFAKRQLTWLKRDKEIKWFHRQDQEIVSEINAFLGS